MQPPWTRQWLINDGYNIPSSPRTINSIVWHSMEGWLAGAISTWNTGVAGAHICITRSGEVVLSCPLEYVAWHAGTTRNTGRTEFWKSHNINAYSVGIELEGFAHSGFTKEQIDACVLVGRYLTKKYSIPVQHTFDQLAGHHLHSDISNQRSDPGPHFPMNNILQRIRE